MNQTIKNPNWNVFIPADGDSHDDHDHEPSPHYEDAQLFTFAAISVTRFGDFWKFLVVWFLPKVAQKHG